MAEPLTWHRPRARCPECRKSMALRFERQLVALADQLIDAMGVDPATDVVSYKCQGCRAIYAVSLETVAGAQPEA